MSLSGVGQQPVLTAPVRPSAPGKTFLVGEYLALRGGPSLLLTTAPRFELTFDPAYNSGKFPFASASPAGLYHSRVREVFKTGSLSFDDPHHGRGGLGASSAQFALLYVLSHQIRDLSCGSLKDILSDYVNCAWNGVGTPRSGADVIAQIMGGVTWFDGITMHAERLSWKFPRITFTLFRTGTKLATHEHLRETSEIPIEGLRDAVTKARAAFDRVDETLLVQAVRETGSCLSAAGLLADKTRSYLSDLPAGLAHAAKGCGAMGADILMVLHDRTRAQDVRLWARERGLESCGSEADLGEGLLSTLPLATLNSAIGAKEFYQ